MPSSGRTIVEIGPGLGDLTRELVASRNVVAFEVDDDLCHVLKKTFSAELSTDRLELQCGDVLEHWKKGTLIEQPYDLIANLPYYVATNIILRALEDTNCCTIYVMVQKEVARKFAAQSGQREFSALSVLAQTTGRVEMPLEIPPEAFNPPPKVISSMLKIEKTESLDDKSFQAFLKHAFSQPRKKLIKNLGAGYEKLLLEEAFSSLDLNRAIRPHELETRSYHQLYQSIYKGGSNGKPKRESGNQ